MPRHSRSRHFPLRVEAIEPRDLTAGLGLAGSALALSSSPVVEAARAAMLAYKVGQLAYTGHTSLLLGTVQVSQPFALRNLGTSSLASSHPTTAPLSVSRSSSPWSLSAERGDSFYSRDHSASAEPRGGQDHRGNGHGHHGGWDHSAHQHGGDGGHGRGSD